MDTLEEIDDTLYIDCSTCDAKFKRTCSDTQGYGCACVIYQHNETNSWRVHGFYGSRLFDMNVLQFNDLDSFSLPNPMRTMDPVCDICVQSWVLQGCLILVDGDEL